MEEADLAGLQLQHHARAAQESLTPRLGIDPRDIQLAPACRIDSAKCARESLTHDGVRTLPKHRG